MKQFHSGTYGADIGSWFRWWIVPSGRPYNPATRVQPATGHCHTNQGHCISCHSEWGLAVTNKCLCDTQQTMLHIVISCPQTKLEAGLQRLHSVMLLFNRDEWNLDHVCCTLVACFNGAIVLVYEHWLIGAWLSSSPLVFQHDTGYSTDLH